MIKYANIIDSGIALSKTENVLGYSAWPSVARDADGNILMACSGNRIMHVCPFGKVLVVKSKNEGKSWSSPMIAVDTPLDDRDAGILSLGGGRLMISTFNNTRADQRKWADGGKYGSDTLRNLAMAYLPALSDSQEEKYIGSLLCISEDNGFSWGEPFKAPVTSPHGPCLLKSGSLIYAGIPYHSDLPALPGHPVAVYKSDDCRNFYKIADIPVCPEYPDFAYNEVHVAELPNGRLVLQTRIDEFGKSYEERVFTICQSVSDDGGKTWTVPKLTGATGAPPHFLYHSSGTLISVYGRRTPGYGIQAMFSKDNGDSWDTDYFIWDKGQNADLGYPASVELDNGDILTVFYTMIPGEKLCSVLWTRWRLPE